MIEYADAINVIESLTNFSTRISAIKSCILEQMIKSVRYGMLVRRVVASEMTEANGIFAICYALKRMTSQHLTLTTTGWHCIRSY